MSILMVCCRCLFTFSKKYIFRGHWCDQISCKAHKVGERLHKVFGLIESLVAMGNIKLP